MTLDRERMDKIVQDSALGRPADYATEEEHTFRQQVDREEFPEGMIEDVPNEIPDL